MSRDERRNLILDCTDKKDMNYSRADFGITYDEMKKEVYVFGD